MNGRRTALTIVAAALLLPGCGGGTTALTGANAPSLPNQTLDGVGGPNSRSAAPGVTAAAGTTKRAGLFVTGGAPAGYEHAWVTLQKVEVVDTAQRPTTIWEDRDGLSVDLATLQDATGPLYALLTSALVPSGHPQGRMRVTLGKALLLYAPGATVAKPFPLSDSLPRDDEGRPILSYALAKAHDVGTGKDDLVIAFDPAKIVLNDGRAKLVASDGSKAARATLVADASRQIPALFTGTIDDTASGEGPLPPAAAPSPAAAGKGRKATEAAAPSVTAAASPTPAPSPVTKASPSPAPTAAAPTFTLRDASGQSVVVQVEKGIALQGEGTTGDIAAKAKAETPASGIAPAAPSSPLTGGKRVWVRGTLAEDTKRIVASEVVLLPAAPAVASTDDGAAGAAAPEAEAAIVGAASGATSEGGAFSLVARQVYGLSPTQGTVTVVLGNGASLRGRDGQTLSAADLYAALKRAGGAAVEAAGAYDPVTGTLTASRVTMDPPGPPLAARTASARR